MPRNNLNFNSDNIRIIKIRGGNDDKSYVINGLVFIKCVEGSIKKISNAKIAAYSCSFGVNNLSYSVSFLN